MEKSAIKTGKRYWFYINDYDGSYKSGLLTGEKEENGNVILMTKTGERWSIPPENLYTTIPTIRG